jgi:hypothetical protein
MISEQRMTMERKGGSIVAQRKTFVVWNEEIVIPIVLDPCTPITFVVPTQAKERGTQ